MKLPAERPALLVSLPRNDPSLAEKAAEAGADGLKVHINVHHRTSGTSFGSLAAELEPIREILALGLPTGLVIGAQDVMDADEHRAARDLGFDYFDAYASDAPASYVTDCGPVTPMLALGPGDRAAEAVALVARGVKALELSTLEPERYGSPLSMATVARLTAVVAAVDVPVVLPSQHRLCPTDVEILTAAGASAILLGAVVTGTGAGPFGYRIAQFAAAVRSGLYDRSRDRLQPGRAKRPV
jgi:hypothetical protein